MVSGRASGIHSDQSTQPQQSRDTRVDNATVSWSEVFFGSALPKGLISKTKRFLLQVPRRYLRILSPRELVECVDQGLIPDPTFGRFSVTLVPASKHSTRNPSAARTSQTSFIGELDAAKLLIVSDLSILQAMP